MMITFAMKVNDSFGNGYGMSPNDVVAATVANYQGDGYVANADVPVPCAGVLRNLHVNSQIHTLNGDGLLVKLFVNGVDSGVGVTVTSTGLVADTSNEVEVAAGDMISFGTDPQNASSGSYRIVGSIEFAPAA